MSCLQVWAPCSPYCSSIPPAGHLYLSKGTLSAYWNAFLDLLNISPHWVPWVTCVGVIVDSFKKSSFCNCHDGLCSRHGRRSRRVFLIIRSGHIQFVVKTAYVTELHMVVMLCVFTLKPIFGANSSLPTICFCMSGYALRYHSRTLFEDAICTKELDQNGRFQHTERLRRQRIEFLKFVLQLQQPSENDVD